MNELDKILKKAEKERDSLKHPYVGTEHLLLSLLSYDNELTEYLKKYNLTYNKFKKELKRIIGEGSKKSPYVLYTPMLRKVLSIAENNNEEININLFNAIIEAKEGIALRIIESMNIHIEKIDINNINYLIIDEQEIISNREKEISEIFQILMRKNKCNPLLIGDAGVGKTAIVEEIQRRLINKKVPKELMGYKIINIDLSSLIAGTKYRGDFEDKVNKLLKKVENEKSIIFIDEIHTLINAGGAEGAISAGNIIKPYLARGKIKCIGATTINEYHNYFEKDSALERRFQKIIIKETDYNSTVNILENLKTNYESFHNIKINSNIIKEIVNYANKYITNRNNPDKSIELLDSCCTNAKYNNQDEVTINNIYQVFELRSGINLENQFIKNIIDNKKIIISSKNNILNISNTTCNIINIDGNKIKSIEDMYDILGNPLNKNNYYLLKSTIDNPIGIITIINYNYNEILKEFIEKVLNNRIIKNSFGQKIDLNNYIIILEEIENNNIGFSSNVVLNNLKDSLIRFDNEKLLLNT